MSKWEDIVKDKLEGYESALPEGGLAKFRARREGAAPVKKRFPTAWAAAAACAAIAAGLAALLFPPRPQQPQEAIQIVQDQPVAETTVPDTADVPEPVQNQTQHSQPAPLTLKRSTPVKATAAHLAENTVASAEEALLPAEPEPSGTPDPSGEVSTVSNEKQWAGSPFIPQKPAPRPVRLRVAPTAGVVAGSGLLAAILTPGTKRGALYTSVVNVSDNNPSTPPDSPGSIASSVWPDPDNPYNPYPPVSVDPGGSTEPDGPIDPEEPVDVLYGKYTHYRPLKTGLSTRIPLTDQLSVTTGLTYSLYCSKFTYSLSGEKAQQVHYLGIPVRLDWTLASNRWLDVYVGGGVAGDFCVGSALGGETFTKDGPAFSVLGAGGLQWNMTRRVGLYVEPELSWTAPSDRHILRTYRKEHPFVFTVATGIRINLGKQ